MADLVTVDEVRATLGDSVADRADVALLISTASAAIEDYCNRAFDVEGSVTETHDGTGTPNLILNRPPVATIVSVSVDGDALDNSAGEEWVLIPRYGILYRGDGVSGLCWPLGVQNVEVSYTGGYTAVPDPVRYATLLHVRQLTGDAAIAEAVRRRRLGDAEIEFHDVNKLSPMARSVRALLDHYRLPRVR